MIAAAALPALRPPVMGVSRHVLEPARAMQPVPVGVPLAELARDVQAAEPGPLLCRCNGEWLLREDWASRTRPGDVVEWFVLPQDKAAARLILTIAVAYITGGAGLGLTGWQYAAANIAASAVINTVLADSPAAARDTGPAASPTYSTGVQGNRARLYDAIPKILGRMRVVPPFAGDPYTYYDANGDQYFCALYAVGIGNHRIEKVLLADTPISHFQDVLVAQYLPPGTLPSTVDAAVETSTEVAGQELRDGLYIGGFAACMAHRTTQRIEIDMLAPRGLGYADGAGFANLSVIWRVEWREINEFGVALTPWQQLGTHQTRTAATNTVQRWTHPYDLPYACRPEIRVVRVDAKQDSNLALHELVWGGMRAFLEQAAPLNEHTAHFELVMRASEQLSNISQASVAMIAWGLARTWSPGGGWGAEVETRNPAWHLAELWSSAVWGDGLPDSRIDLQTLYELAQAWDARQDRCDLVLDTRQASWDVAQTIARTGRGRVFRRGGVMTVARDQWEELPVTAFTPRNCGEMTLVPVLPQREQPDGIIAEYFDYRSWTWRRVECPCPGVVTMLAPETRRYPGIVGPTQAKREGLYDAAAMALRKVTVSGATEMQGWLPAYLSTVRWLPEIPGYGQSGDVTDWDAGTLTMSLSEPPQWGASNYLTLIRDDGSLTTPVAVTPGATQWDVVLPGAPDFALVLDSATRERPKYLFGSLTAGDELVKITRIADAGQGGDGVTRHEIEAVVDDIGVHTADNAWLPGPGDVQDDVAQAEEVDPGGGTLILVNLASTHWVLDSPAEPNDPEVTITMTTTGTNTLSVVLGVASVDGGPYVAGLTAFPQEWMRFPVEPATAALYEMRATVLSVSGTGVLDVTAGTLNTWLPMTSNRSWTIADTVGALGTAGILVLRLEVREASTGIVQDSGTYTIELRTPGSPG